MATIKKIIKALVPPVVFTIALKSGIIYTSIGVKINQTWSGDYPNWKEAEALCSGYDSQNILEKCKNALLMVKNGEAVYERDSVIFNEVQYSFGLLAGLQRAALENNGKLTVLDFGGSLGSTYFQNKFFLNVCKEVNWCIVEQSHFVDCGKTFFEDNQLQFFYSIDDCLAKHKPDVVLLSSVLQYLDKPYDWLNQLMSYNIPYLIIDRTAMLDEDKDLLTIQLVPDEIYKASYPSWFFSKSKLERILLKDYKLISFFDSGFTPPTVVNDKHKVYWGGFILKK
ncbi:MAG: TIGR04325 family methyltransferase [Bacteroidota bacterium]